MNWGIRPKILGLLFALSFVLIAISVFLFLDQSETLLRKKTVEDFHLVAWELSYNIERTLMKAHHDAQVLATHPMLADAGMTPESASIILQRFQIITGLYEDISLISSTGDVIASTHYRFRGDWRYNETFIRAVRGLKSFSYPQMMTDPRRLVVWVCHPVLDEDNNVGAVIILQLGLDTMADIVNHVAIGSTGHAYLIDQHGRYLTHPDRSMLLSRAPGVFTRFDIAEKTEIRYPGKEGQLHLGSIVKRPPNKVLDPYLDWMVLVTQSESEILAHLKPIVWEAIMLGLIAFLIVGGIGFQLSRSITKPLVRLAHAAGQISRGDFEMRLDTDRGDEIGALSRAFLSMSTDLLESRKETEAGRKRFQELANFLPQIVYEADENGVITFLNNYGWEITGADPELLGKVHFSEAIHPDDRVNAVESFRRIIAGEPVTDHEYRIITRDDSSIVALFSSTPIMRDGQCRGLRGIAVDISLRRKFEDVLQSERSRLLNLLERLPAYVFLQDKYNNIVFSNGRFKDLFGDVRRHTECVDIHNEGKPCPWCMGQDFYTNPAGKGDERLLSVSGAVFHTYTYPFEDHDGTVLMLQLGIDITDQKQAEEAYAVLTEHSLQGLAIIQDHHAVYLNQTLADLLGLPADILIGFTGADILARLHPEDQARAKEPMLYPYSVTTDIHIESLRFLKSDNSYCHLEMFISPIYYKGHPALQVTCLDRTEQFQIQQALALEKDRLLVTLRSITEGVIAVNDRGVIHLINPAACDMIGITRESAIGRNLREVYRVRRTDGRAEPVDLITTVVKTERAIEPHEPRLLVSLDNAEYPISDLAAPIRDAAGAVTGVVIVFRNIGEKVKSEAEMIRNQKLESIGVLAGGIAHDFNNILMAILGNISLARTYAENNEKIRGILKEAEGGCAQARRLTQQLLTFAKGGAPVMEIASIADLINDSARFVLRGSAIQCQIDLPGDLRTVNVDTGQISQVVHNLVLNAQQAMPAGGIIRITGSNYLAQAGNPQGLEPGEYVKVMIADQGCGMAPELLSKIFDPYFTTRDTGTGLGLSIVHSIIHRHGGSIEVASEVGRGTCFTFCLPVSAKRKKTTEQDMVILKPGQGRVLLMDDEEIVRSVAKRMLERFGYTVEFALEGDEALKRFNDAISAGTPFDVVILDLTIPGGKGGLETLNQMKAIDPGVKAVVSSGYSNDPVLAKYKDFGFMAKIIKPYDLKQIIRTMQLVLEGGTS